MMTAFNTYQIALVVVLVLNLVFWILVICFRLFFHFPCGNNDNQQRRRRRFTRRQLQVRRSSSEGTLVGISNDTFVGDDGLEPYSINGNLEAPPSYEDAIKHSTILLSQRMSPHLNRQQEGSSQSRRPVVYEQSVLLMVPEESTSVSETRLTTSLDSTNDGVRSSSAAQAAVALNLPAEFGRNDDSSIMQECCALTSADDRVLQEDSGSVTFVLGNPGAPTVHMSCSTRNELDFVDGRDLDALRQA